MLRYDTIRMQRAPWQSETIPELLRLAAERYTDLTAIEDEGTRLSFAELRAASLEATRAFIASGVEPGDRVAVWAPNLPEWIVAALGLQGAAAALVPLNTRLKSAEAGAILRKSGARLLLTVGEFLGTSYPRLLNGEELPDLEATLCLREDAKGCTPWREFLARAGEVGEDVATSRSESVASGDLSDILFTSGTTGAPKGVMCEHGATLRCFEAWSGLAGLPRKPSGWLGTSWISSCCVTHGVTREGNDGHRSIWSGSPGSSSRITPSSGC